ncbi:MAG: hypothetical protein BGO98_13395 [Myxococcales bacterium 68-20]|nr:MAG: hypothetical protein BGO98_13395 [Myxococcales bacterium 68-20]
MQDTTATPGRKPHPGAEGESASRSKALEEHGGVPLTDRVEGGQLRGVEEGVPLTDRVEGGQLRGVEEEGRPTTGTQRGPEKTRPER